MADNPTSQSDPASSIAAPPESTKPATTPAPAGVTPSARPLWHQSLPCALGLVLLAAGAFAAIRVLDEPLSRAAQTIQIWNDHHLATRALGVVTTRLTAVRAKLATADPQAPATQKTALSLNEEAGLERQEVEYRDRQKNAADGWLARFGTPIDPKTRPESRFDPFLDRGTYTHAAFHSLVVGTIGIAFMSLASAFLLIAGKLYGLELKDILGFVKDHISSSPMSVSAMVPILGAVAGAGVLSVGAAAGVTTSRTLQPILDASTHVTTTSYRGAPTGASEPRIIVLDRPTPIWLSGSDCCKGASATHPITVRPVFPRDIAVRLTNDVVVAGQAEAFKRLEAAHDALTSQVKALTASANEIDRNTSATAKNASAVAAAVGQYDATLQGLQTRTASMATASADTSMTSAWLVERETQKASLGFPGRLKYFFVGLKPPRAPALSTSASRPSGLPPGAPATSPATAPASTPATAPAATCPGAPVANTPVTCAPLSATAPAGQ